MRRYRISKDRGKLHSLVIITIVIILTVTFIRGVTLSFSNEIGQAKYDLTTILMSKLSVHILESGSSLLRYEASAEEGGASLPVSILSDQLALHEFIKKDQTLATLMQNQKGNGMNDYDTVVGNNQRDELAEDYNTRKSNEVIETKEELMSNTNKYEGKLLYDTVAKGALSKEYILTNGVAFNDKTFKEYIASGNQPGYDATGQLSVGVLDGELIYEEDSDYSLVGQGAAIDTFGNNVRINYTLEQLKNYNFLLQNFYIVDQDTRVTEDLFDADAMLKKDMTIQNGNEAPQILIYHTHSQEAFVDSRAGNSEDSVVGIGTYLAEILQEQYGYNVIHDTGVYDLVNGVLDRSKAYDYAEESITKILEENPSIEVVIDLHRDGAPKRSTLIDGKETARVMLFNGLSRDTEGTIKRLPNPNLQDNLAFSFQLQLKANDMYPGLFYKNYLNSYRYNLHVRQKSILVELGTHENTIRSARNAMEPFAEVLDAVLQGE